MFTMELLVVMYGRLFIGCLVWNIIYADDLELVSNGNYTTPLNNAGLELEPIHENDPLLGSKNDLLLRSKNEPLLRSKNDPLLSSKKDLLHELKNDPLLRSINDPLLRSKNDSLLRSKNDSLLRSKKDYLLRSKNDSLLRLKNDLLLRSKNDLLLRSKNDPLSRSKSDEELASNHSSGNGSSFLDFIANQWIGDQLGYTGENGTAETNYILNPRVSVKNYKRNKKWKVKKYCVHNPEDSEVCMKALMKKGSKFSIAIRIHRQTVSPVNELKQRDKRSVPSDDYDDDDDDYYGEINDVDDHDPELSPDGPDIQHYKLDSPPYRPESPPYRPDSPPYKPESPPYRPESQPNRPESQPYKPESQLYRSNSQLYRPKSPPYKPESPQYRPESLPYRPESPPYRPESPSYKPESPPYRPESPAYRPESPPHGPQPPRYRHEFQPDGPDLPLYRPESPPHGPKPSGHRSSHRRPKLLINRQRSKPKRPESPPHGPQSPRYRHEPPPNGPNAPRRSDSPRPQDFEEDLKPNLSFMPKQPRRGLHPRSMDNGMQNDPDAVELYSKMYPGDAPRDWDKCRLPKGRDTNEILCKMSDKGVACRLLCVHGHTFPEGIVRRTRCEYQYNKWSEPFTECQPFVDCTLRIKSAGHLSCTTNTLCRGPRCQVTCERYAVHDATPPRQYECGADGRWNPHIPHCVERKGAELTNVPAGMKTHRQIQYP